MREVEAISGSDAYQYLGFQVLATTNVGDSSQFWYTSRSATGNLHLHSVIVFRDLESGEMYTDVTKDLYGYPS